MSRSLRLQVGDVSATVHPLVSSRAVRVVKVVCRGRRTWAINDKGELLCSSLGEIKRMGHYPPSADITSLREDDITALGLLGIINAKAALVLKEERQFERDVKCQLESLQRDAEDVKGAGVKLPSGYMAKLESAARKYAVTRRSRRRAQLKAAAKKVSL